MSDQDPKSTANPLYGAPPPPTVNSGEISNSAPLMGTGPKAPVPESTNPLFGATPPPAPTISARTPATPPRIPTRSSRLPLHHPSTLPSYLGKLGYILSIVLGSSAVIAGIWSAVLLPLLHASFSARKALVDQQKDRWAGLVGGLKEIRSRAVYPPAPPTEQDDSMALQSSEKSSEEKGDSESARLVDHHDPEDGHQDGDNQSVDVNAIERLLPITPVSSLSSALSNLLVAFTSTSTTRTSLLSTLESYTSYLHRQLYLRSQPISTFGGNRYGLNTLSANLAKAGGGKSSSAWGYDQSEGEGNDAGLEAVGVKGEEWDAVRKEVRAIKGMLLSRRNFAPSEAEVR